MLSVVYVAFSSVGVVKSPPVFTEVEAVNFVEANEEVTWKELQVDGWTIKKFYLSETPPQQPTQENLKELGFEQVLPKPSELCTALEGYKPCAGEVWKSNTGIPHTNIAISFDGKDPADYHIKDLTFMTLIKHLIEQFEEYIQDNCCCGALCADDSLDQIE